MERLNNSVRNGAISSATSFITETGSGSAAELLSGRRDIAETMSKVALWRSGFRSSSDSEFQRQRHDDHTCSAGTLGRRASCGWLNGDAVGQRLERPACTAQTSSRALGREDTCISSSRACILDPICHIEPAQLSVKELCQTAVVLPCAAHDSRCSVHDSLQLVDDSLG